MATCTIALKCSNAIGCVNWSAGACKVGWSHKNQTIRNAIHSRKCRPINSHARVRTAGRSSRTWSFSLLPATLVQQPQSLEDRFWARRVPVREWTHVTNATQGNHDSRGDAPAPLDDPLSSPATSSDATEATKSSWPASAGWVSALAIFSACFATAFSADTHVEALCRLAPSAASASSAAGTCLMPPFLVSAVASALLGFAAVHVLSKIKAGQVVRLEGPSSHLVSKSGTPTLGGISFVPVAAAVAAWWCRASGIQGSQVGLVTALATVTCAYGAIGLADDWASLRRRKNEGLAPRTKLLLQLLVGELFLYWFSRSSIFETVGTTIKLINGWSLPLGPLYWPFALFTMTAMSNGVNLTDGLDGLAAGVCAATLMGFAVMSLPLAAGTAVFSSALAGACCGFLVHNRHKAAMFMGDTGSLALGGALGAAAVSTGQLFPLLLASGVYLAETVSVILQVWYYKSTKGPDGKGKRLLQMAPLHHHFELRGWPETQVVTVFYAVAVLLAMLACWVGLKM